MTEKTTVLFRRAAVLVVLVGLAWMQTGPAVNSAQAVEGSWFLFGFDSVSHDIPVQLWIWSQVLETGELPLWMPPLKGGLPTIGAFLWTPFAPSLWLHALLPFPLAQRLQFLLAFFWAGLGTYWLARVLGLKAGAALFAAVGFGFSGHLVTLVHPGHLQKILAIAWLPWIAGGAVKAFASGIDPAGRLRASAAGGAALGFCFLAGHPQIAYIGLALIVLRLVWALAVQRAGKHALLAAVLLLGLGGLGGAAQLLPGLQMSADSNRAGGVAWEEAVATSYPPGEVWEFFLPRFRGDSSATGHDLYFGDWGERLVSDYAGVIVVFFALGAAMAARYRRESGFWYIVLLLSLLVGFGSSTPLYRALYTVLPGFDSFRSPGTFMAAAALALPVLGGMGLDALTRVLHSDQKSTFRILRTLGIAAILCGLMYAIAHFYAAPALVPTVDLPGEVEDPFRKILFWTAMRRSFLVLGLGLVFIIAATAVARRPALLRPLAGGGLALLLGADLVLANSAFLRAEPWGRFEAAMSPGPIELAIADEPEPRRVFEPGRELSLRPILNDRDALLGYHPISFEIFEEHLRATGTGSPEWRAQWGVNLLWFPAPREDVPEEILLFERLRDGSVLYRDTATPGAVRLADGAAPAAWEWLDRTPNAETMRVEVSAPAKLVVAQNRAAGWQMRVGESPWEAAPREPALERGVDLAAGESTVAWRYRPAAWRIGFFLTALGGCLALALGIGAWPRRRRG